MSTAQITGIGISIADVIFTGEDSLAVVSDGGLIFTGDGICIATSIAAPTSTEF